MSIFRKSVEKIQVSLKSDKKMCTLREDQHTFFIISRPFLLRKRNVSEKFVHNLDTRILCSVT